MTSTGKLWSVTRHVVPTTFAVMVGMGSVSAYADVSLSATGSDGKVTLSWTTTDNLRGIQVYRDTDANPSGRQRVAILPSSARSYTDTGVTNGRQYWYWIKYTDANRVTGNSNAGSATPATSNNGNTGATCANAVPLALPKVFTGAMDTCLVTSGTIDSVNSWGAETVDINGVSYKSKWSNQMPARINGNYYIRYVAKQYWAHFEINGNGGTDNGGDTQPIAVTSVSVTPSNATVAVKSTASLSATVAPNNATNKNVTWTSSNAGVATVGANGVVTGVAAGNATITARTADGGRTATSTITVTADAPPPPPGACTGPAVGTHGSNPIMPAIYTADPAVLVHDCTFYITAGHDEGTNGFYMRDWYVLSSTDMVNWSDNGGPVLSLDVFNWADANAWAGQMVERNGKYYWYVPVNERGGGMAIGVAVGDSPLGPFHDAIGAPLVNDAIEMRQFNYSDAGQTVYTIDPTVFVDDNGQAYLAYGGFGRMVTVALGDNMISLKGNMVERTPDGYFEAPYLTKRNGTYYMVYAAGVNPATIDYATSNSPTGPWQYRGRILDALTGLPGQDAPTSHPAIAEFAGQWYLVYHLSNGPGGGTYRRQVAIDKLTFNADGTIQKVTPSSGLTFADNGSGTQPVAVTGVSVTPANAKVAIKSTTSLSATVAPANAANKSVTWTSSNTGVATVSASGIVTGVAAGNATITARTADGGRTASSTVTVSAAPDPVVPNYTLTIGVSGSGTTSVSAGSHSYKSGTAVTITATPASGSVFSGWSGAFTGNTNPLTIAMDGNKSLTAMFATQNNGGDTGNSGISGSTETTWAESCPTSQTPACVAGNWRDPGSTTGDPAQCESAHFVVHSPNGTISAAQCQAAIDHLENVVWPGYFGSPVFFPEPYCDSTTKWKASVHIHSDYALTGGSWGDNYMGMWIGPNATADHWGLAHEFTHGVQSVAGKLGGCDPNTCGWLFESHANFMPHQLPEFKDNIHCSEMLVNAPHVYLGSTRDRYCNWQWMEYLKDKQCYKAVNDIWAKAQSTKDPFMVLKANMGWSQAQLNDFFGEWAMHNITWDYRNPPPTSKDNAGAMFRSNYGPITDTSRAERQLRLTELDPIDLATRRFTTPSAWAPQRWGYNVVRLRPDTNVDTVTVTFRGVTGGNNGWRWGLVATDAGLTKARYSPVQPGTDGQVAFKINSGESLWLVVVGAPTNHETIVWDQMYNTVHRYPWMVQLQGAWPEGWEGGRQSDCGGDLVRHANGGGCASANLASSVYVGPYARVQGGNVSGNARIDDHATILGGTVSGGTVAGLTLLTNGFTVSGGKVATTFYPMGFFEGSQSVSGSAQVLGDVEYRGQGLNKSSGTYYGFVDSGTGPAGNTNDVSPAGPYVWRP